MRKKRLIAELLRIQDRLIYSHDSKIIECAIRELKNQIPEVQESRQVHHLDRQALSSNKQESLFCPLTQDFCDILKDRPCRMTELEEEAYDGQKRNENLRVRVDHREDSQVYHEMLLDLVLAVQQIRQLKRALRLQLHDLYPLLLGVQYNGASNPYVVSFSSDPKAIRFSLSEKFCSTLHTSISVVDYTLASDAEK